MRPHAALLHRLVRAFATPVHSRACGTEVNAPSSYAHPIGRLVSRDPAQWYAQVLRKLSHWTQLGHILCVRDAANSSLRSSAPLSNDLDAPCYLRPRPAIRMAVERAL